MQKKSAGSENLIGVGGSIEDGAAKIWGQLVVGLLSNFKNRNVGGWLSLFVMWRRACITFVDFAVLCWIKRIVWWVLCD